MSKALAVLCAFAGLAASVPAPESTALLPLRATPLAGTTWSGDDVVGPTVYHFEPGGVLKYSYRGATWRNATWRQEGDKVYFEMNQKFREFEGTMAGDVISGKSWNTRGDKWLLVILPQKIK